MRRNDGQWPTPRVYDLVAARIPTLQRAIDPIFVVNETESWCWSSTTHLDGPQPDVAAHICFGQAFGYMGPEGGGQWLNVHGAGAQRSDPKSGDPADWPYGRGPQGDEIRIFNYVRAVRDADASCSQDLNQDGSVDAADLALLLGSWGPNPGHPADFDGDGNVGAVDLAMILGNWGDCS